MTRSGRPRRVLAADRRLRPLPHRGVSDLDPDGPYENPIITIVFTAVSPDDVSAPPTTDLALHIDFPEGVDDDEVECWLHRGIESGWADTVDRLEQHLGQGWTIDDGTASFDDGPSRVDSVAWSDGPEPGADIPSDRPSE